MSVEQGDPPTAGMYVAYIEPYNPGFPVARRELLLWYDGRWCYNGSDQFYRGVVYGWIGPLPTRRVESFLEPVFL